MDELKVGRSVDFRCKACQRKNAGLLRAAGGALAVICRKFPETVAGRRASALLAAWGLK